jgi:hypothetical protein
MFRLLGIASVVSSASACSDHNATSASDVVNGAEILRRSTAIRNCEGPATSLSPSLAAALPPRTGNMQPDDQWADLAERVPGGFAGFIGDGGKLVLFLTDPSQAAAAKAALAGKASGVDVQSAEVRQARWDFAQLVNWFNYLSTQSSLMSTPGMSSADKNEAINRIVYGTVDSASRLLLIEKLQALDLPCDLIRVEVTGRVTLL